MTAFTRIAPDYDNLWLLSDDYRDWMLKKLLEHLKMRTDSKFADLGGGTGLFTHLLKQRVPLEYEPICVDPSQAMLLNVERYSGVRAYSESAEAFIQRRMKLDRILIKEAIHHIQDRQRFWKKVCSSLTPNGRVLVVTRPSVPEFPLFRRAAMAFSESQPRLEVLLDELSGSGLKVTAVAEEYLVVIPKTRWYSMLRARFMSSLAHFTQSEIEQGIIEIDGRTSESEFRFTDRLLFLEIEHQHGCAR